MGFTKAILGSSGGIDSAVTLAIAVEALGKENVRAILMPSPFSTDHSINDAVQLSKNLDNPYDIIHIHEVFDSFMKTLKPVFLDLPFSLAEENIQSRSRGNLLMAIAINYRYMHWHGILTVMQKSFLKILLPKHPVLNCDLIRKTVIACLTMLFLIRFSTSILKKEWGLMRSKPWVLKLHWLIGL
jgi:7-cyano-7-deazaguanine synthase in queuosine biosynthesis